jgi:Na+/H+ antiporter NhaD/arsenite permease-like protein
MHQALSESPGLWLLLPFMLQLLAVALLPVLAPRWWEHHLPKVSLLLGGIVSLHYILALHAGARLLEAFHEYAGFILLLTALFMVAGGIYLRIEGPSTPTRNVLFLLAGALLTNVIGTTGASMLLIRPWIRMNQGRFSPFHAVFFIFLISNIGGCLTPVGDPPLFLGFLKGVPFWWSLQHLWKPWMLAVTVLVVLFYLMDRRHLPADSNRAECPLSGKIWEIEGGINFLLLGVILSAVFLPSPWREVLLGATALLSWRLTPRRIHRKNSFSFAPMREVAWIFLGIFATMIPVLDALGFRANALSATFEFGPGHFYYFTGILSSLLDNAPTYLAFLSVEMGLHGGSLNDPGEVARVAMETPLHLIAISLGAVFFGAMTYIGNGPNYMVNAMVSQSGIRMPGFLGYVVRYSLPILLPVLILVAWIFLV